MWEIIVWRSMWYTVFTGITVLWREGGKTESVDKEKGPHFNSATLPVFV